MSNTMKDQLLKCGFEMTPRRRKPVERPPREPKVISTIYKRGWQQPPSVSKRRTKARVTKRQRNDAEFKAKAKAIRRTPDDLDKFHQRISTMVETMLDWVPRDDMTVEDFVWNSIESGHTAAKLRICLRMMRRVKNAVRGFTPQYSTKTAPKKRPASRRPTAKRRK